MPPQVGRAAPPRSASMRTAWPAAPSAMPWGRRPDRRPPARDPRQAPAGDARHPGSRHRGASAPAGPVVTRFGALDTRPSCPSTGCAAALMAASAPLGRLANRPSPAHRPMSPTARPPRSARHRLVTGSRRSAQGPPAPHPATPRSVPARPLRARTLCRAHRDRREN